jgi:thiamine-monophosphate kinase
MKRVRLGRGGEFDLIRRFVDAEGSTDAASTDVAVGPGDDAAVLRDGWVVTTDLSVEDVHFRRSWLSDEEIGRRSAAVALSDLAAMAATPVAVLVSIAAPRARAPEAAVGPEQSGTVDLEALNRGLRAVAESLGAAVVGGDLSRSPGPLFVDVVALGRTAWPVQRDGAEPGDDVWVTGTLGGSAAAVELWESGEPPPDELRAAYATPEPRIEAACCLVEQEVVDALIDLSDGLAGDAGHLAAASGVKIVLDETALPVEPVVVRRFGVEHGRELALHGGEDYELCFVTDPGVVDPEYFRSKYGLSLTRVGTVEELDEGQEPGVWLRTASGEVVELKRGGWDHWARADGPPEDGSATSGDGSTSAGDDS